MKSFPYALVIFDLDGTLLDTVAEITMSANAGLVAMGLPTVTDAQTRDWVGNGAENFFARAVAFAAAQGGGSVAALPTPDSDIYQAGFAHFLSNYARLSGQHSTVYPHVRDALVQLQSQGVKLAVLTNKIKAFADTALQAHDLLHFFDDVLGGDSLPQKKPDPAGIRLLQAKHGVDNDRTLFVGDSATDVATARNAVVTVWALPYGYNHGNPIADAAPDKVINDFSVFLTRSFS